jgi:YegS/Rv2252/BmrU family lipid kinase
MKTHQNIAFIINPISGIGNACDIERMIKANMDSSRFNTHVFYTQAPKDGTRMALEAMKTCDIVVAVGGDGSVNDVAKALVNTDKILGIIPSGSGNGLARHLGLSLDVKEALQRVQNGVTQTIDTLTVNDALCISIAGVGFDADVAEQFNKRKKRGFLRYAEIIFGEYLLYESKTYNLSFDGQKIETESLMINFANSNQFGYGFKIAPNADLTDGLMDVIVLKKPNILWSPIETVRFFRNVIHCSKHCQTYQTDHVKLKRKNPDWVNIDGEAIWMPREIEVSVLPKSLNVIC